MNRQGNKYPQPKSLLILILSPQSSYRKEDVYIQVEKETNVAVLS